MKRYKDNNYEFLYEDKIYLINKIDPRLELKREKLLENVFYHFNKIVLKYIPEKYIVGKKSAKVILDQMLSVFIMDNLDFSEDPVIPTNPINFSNLKENLRVKLSKGKYKSGEFNKIIDKIIDELDLKNKFINSMKLLIIYYKNLSYDTQKVIKTEKNKIITLSFQNNHIDIYYKLYDKLVKRFIKLPSKVDIIYDIDLLIYCLIKRNIILIMYNLQLAVHPDIMNKLYKNYNINFELFGSAINVNSDKYCSTFYDIEKYFGSYGSFF